MKFNHTCRVWMVTSMLQLLSHALSAQCNPPGAFWLHVPQTSTALTFNWSAAPGALQYQMRFWEAAAPQNKFVVESVSAPYVLTGLRKNTLYSMQIRSVCASGASNWGSAVSYLTSPASGDCLPPENAAVTISGASAFISWTSVGSHTVCYRAGSSGDWIIPPGGMDVGAPPFAVNGLGSGIYQFMVKRNCSNSASNFVQLTANIGDGCQTPLAPAVTPQTTLAVISLPFVNNLLGYAIEYRQMPSGLWQTAAVNVSPPTYSLGPLLPATQYQVRIQATCVNGTSAISLATDFSTLAGSACLPNKDYGKNLSPDELAGIDRFYNTPSPFSYGSMIGVTDGGLFFRAFQNVGYNQITALTTNFRNFHTMDEDYDNTLQSYALNIKPKDTSPEGTPGFMGYNRNLYNLYHNTHGFTQIVASTEILQYAPQSWKEKIFKESDWSQAGPSGIKGAFSNYTRTFIDQMAPPNGAPSQVLAATFQVGNELWDYPIAADYQSLLAGAHEAFTVKYGAKQAGGWKMKLAAGAFQAYRPSNCTSFQRDFSNCGGSLERHDFIGDYLDVANCDILKDLDAIDCHPYSFIGGTINWTFPENPKGETWQIKNMAGWKKANTSQETGVLAQAQLWSTEFGFDSNPVTGVGEKTQSAYLIRGLLMHSRYHFEKVFFYNAFDMTRPNDTYYNGLYNSSGFWKLGTNPANAAWSSPLEQNGATPKPAWFGMLDWKNRFGQHVFVKALKEDAEAFVYLIALPDGSSPYLVFWSPQHTTDANINTPIGVNIMIDWTNVLPTEYKLNTINGQVLALDNNPGEAFSAFTGLDCNKTTLLSVRRNPAFVPLTACQNCSNITHAGKISGPVVNAGTNPFDPAFIGSAAEATGGSGGSIVYQWEQSLDNVNYTPIAGANGLTYDPPALSQSTYFRRCAWRTECDEMLHTAAVLLVVSANNCPVIATFKRRPNLNGGCNTAGDYFFEVVLTSVTVADEILLKNLPINGLSIPMSNLNGALFNTISFNANIQFVGQGSFKWIVNPANGSTQTLRIYYCWSGSYPSPVSVTTATSKCSGAAKPCEAAQSAVASDDRGQKAESGEIPEMELVVYPNPGAGLINLNYTGRGSGNAQLQVVSAMGQVLQAHRFAEFTGNQNWQIDASGLPKGLYFLRLLDDFGVKTITWEKG